MSPLSGPGGSSRVVGAPRAIYLPWGALGPHVPTPPPRLTLSPASLLQDWLLNSHFSFFIQASALPRGSRVWRGGPQRLALGSATSSQTPCPPRYLLQPLGQGLLKKRGGGWRFARAGSGEDGPPVPATRFACDKALPQQNQWASLQPAPGA